MSYEIAWLKDTTKVFFSFYSVFLCLQCFDAGRQEGHPAKCKKLSGGVLTLSLIHI